MRLAPNECAPSSSAVDGGGTGFRHRIADAEAACRHRQSRPARCCPWHRPILAAVKNACPGAGCEAGCNPTPGPKLRRRRLPSSASMGVLEEIVALPPASISLRHLYVTTHTPVSARTAARRRASSSSAPGSAALANGEGTEVKVPAAYGFPYLDCQLPH